MKNPEVWLVNFAPSVGNEIAKIRPAIIVSNNMIVSLELKIVVPLTTHSVPHDWHVKISPSRQNGLTKPSLADCSQLKSFSKERFIKKIGILSEPDMDRVKWALSITLDLI